MSTLGRPAKGLIKLLPNLDLSGSAVRRQNPQRYSAGLHLQRERWWWKRTDRLTSVQRPALVPGLWRCKCTIWGIGWEVNGGYPRVTGLLTTPKHQAPTRKGCPRSRQSCRRREDHIPRPLWQLPNDENWWDRPGQSVRALQERFPRMIFQTSPGAARGQQSAITCNQRCFKHSMGSGLSRPRHPEAITF